MILSLSRYTPQIVAVRFGELSDAQKKVLANAKDVLEAKSAKLPADDPRKQALSRQQQKLEVRETTARKLDL